MSTNKTENYGLHSWTPEDTFLRTEINENFQKLDTEAVRLLFGTYVGNAERTDINTYQRIDLPVTPKAVILFDGGGVAPNYGYAGIMSLGHPISSHMPIDETGFTACSMPSNLKYNEKRYTYHYIVLY